MTDAITLPYTITRGGQLRFIIPAILLSPFFILAVLFLLGSVKLPEAGQDFPLLVMVLAVLVPMDAVAAWVMLKATQPAVLTLYPGFITVKPLPVLGFSVVVAQEHRLADFKAVLLQKVETKGFVKVSLTRPVGKHLLLSGQMKQDVAEQLAAKLGLPVERI